MANLILGTDNGSYLTNGKPNIPFADFVTLLDCKFYIAKGAQEDIPTGISTSLNMIEARKHFEINGEFYWIDPGYTLQWMLDTYSRDFDVNKPDFCGYDIETFKNALGQQYTDAKLTETVIAVVEGMKTRFPHVRHIPYSRQDFILTYCPSLKRWLAQQTRPWWAAYPDWGLDPYLMPWSKIKSGEMRRCTDFNAAPPRPWIAMNVHNDTAGPDMSLFPNYEGWLWQSGSRRQPCNEDGSRLEPVYDHLYDWNYWLGTFDELKAWVKMEAPVQPPTPSPVTLEDLDARLKVLEAEQAKIMALPWYKQFFPIITK